MLFYDLPILALPRSKRKYLFCRTRFIYVSSCVNIEHSTLDVNDDEKSLCLRFQFSFLFSRHARISSVAFFFFFSNCPFLFR